MDEKKNDNVIVIRVRVTEVTRRETKKGAPWLTVKSVHECEDREGSTLEVPFRFSVWSQRIIPSFVEGMVGVLKCEVGGRSWEDKVFMDFKCVDLKVEKAGDDSAAKAAQKAAQEKLDEELPFAFVPPMIGLLALGASAASMIA